MNRQRLEMFVDFYRYLIGIPMKVEDKYVFGYYVPNWTVRDFFLSPNRSRYLYSTSSVIDNCQKAINSHFLDPNPDYYASSSLLYFFTPRPTLSGEIPTANATRLLESAINGSDRNELLLFLQHLSEIHWFDIYNRRHDQRDFTNTIVHWVCTIVG